MLSYMYLYTGGEVPQGMSVYEFPGLECAKFSCKGPMPGSLQIINTKIFNEWLPGNDEYEIAMLHLTGGIIENISSDRNNTLVMVSYTECVNCGRRDQRIVLVIGNNTVILNESGKRISARELQTGMVINATFSAAMTRSIPPQATAFEIQVIR